MREKSIIKKNIMQYLDSKGISKYEFYQKTGVSNGVLSQGSGMSEENILRFLNYYDDISPEWLLTGQEPMLRSESKQQALIPSDSNQGIPLIPIDAMAGFGSGDIRVMDYEVSRYVVPDFEELDVEFMIRVKGSSMYPKYNSGDLVACRHLSLSDIFFQWNKVYVLDTDQGALIKRVKKGSDKEHITLVSDNASYDPFEIHLNQVHAIAIVMGVIRME